MLGRIFSRGLVSKRKTNLKSNRGAQKLWFSVDFEKLEDRVMLSNIVWTNRGDTTGGLNNQGDGFVASFGAGFAANQARAVVDAVLDQWEDIIVDFRHGAGAGPPDIAVTIQVDSTNSGVGASAGTTVSMIDGKPIGGNITLGHGNNGARFFMDPTPNEHSEFMGNIENAFAGDAQAGSPAAGLFDFYSLFNAEITHVLGITSQGIAQGNLFQTGGFNTNTGVADNAEGGGIGNFYVFQGANVNALMTSNNGGSGGSDFGVAIHTAGERPGNSQLSFGGLSLYGVNDNGNAIYEQGRRYIASNKTAMVLGDAFNYQIEMPETFGSFYAVLNESTGVLTVRGGSDNTIINGVAQGVDHDVISISRDGAEIIVSVDIGHDVAGTGPGINPLDQQDAFVTRFAAGSVQSIVVNAGDGNDTITIGENVAIATSIDAGNGNDTIITGSGLTTIASTSNDGDDTIDWSRNPAGITFTANGADRLIGTNFDDTFIVDSTGGLFTSRYLQFDGRGGFDTLRISGGSQISESITLGATNGSGIDTIVGVGGTQMIQFENLEPIITNVIVAALNINGGMIGSLLNAANSINYATSNLFGATWGMVTIDAFEPIHFVNKTSLNIDGEAGSDVISLNNPNLPTGLTSIVVDGGDPTNGDELQVNGVAGVNDDIQYSPTAAGAGTITNPAAATFANVSFSNVEEIVLAGQAADADGLRVLSTAGNDSYAWTAAATGNAGMVTGTAGTFAIAAISYSGMNSYVVPLSTSTAGTDTLVINGSNADDTFVFDGDVVFPPLAAQFPAISVNGGTNLFYATTTSLVTFRGLDGNDTFDVRLPSTVATSLRFEGGDSDSTGDVLVITGDVNVVETVTIAPSTTAGQQTVSGLNNPIVSKGNETISYIGGNSADTLNVALGDGDVNARISNATAGTDQVVSDSLPKILFTQLGTFQIASSGSSNNMVTFVTRNLTGATAANYQADLGRFDTLTIEGNALPDSFRVFNAGEVAVTDQSVGIGATVTVIANGTVLGELNLDTLSGDDLVTVDVDGTDLINVLITYVGGGGSDSLIVTGTPSVTVNSVTYAPGPGVSEGRLTYASTGNSMTIDFTGLEPVTDLVAAANLNINGTNADNAFTYAADPNNANQGRVSIDGFELINFANKTALNLNGLGGSDQFTINNPNVPTGLTNINVNGGPGTTDHLHVIGTPGADTFTLTSGNLVFNTLNVSFTGVDSMLVAGRDNNDTFNVRATSIPVVLAGNAGTDTFNVSSSAPNLSGNLDAISNELRIDGGSGANSMNVSDFSSALANNAIVTLSSITGFAPATILYAATGGTMNLLLSGSNTQPDQFIVQSLLSGDSITINGNGGNDRLVLKPGVLGNANLFGNAGNDVFRVELVGGGNRQVLASGGNGNDNLAVVGSSGPETFQLDSASLTANSEVINFDTMEAMQVFGRDGDDTFNVNATNFFVLLDGGTGNDTYNITGAFPGGNLNNINGPLTANGGSGNNSLNISNLTGAANNAFVTNAHIFGLAPAPINYSSAGGTFDISVEGSGNADNFVVVSLKAADTLAVSGNGGNDHFHVSNAALGNMILSGDAGNDSFVVLLVGSGNRQVTIDGGSGTNPLSILGTSGSDVLHLHNPGVTRGSEDVNYSSISTLYVNTMNGSDVVHINTGAPITRVDGGEGNDHLAVNNTNGISNLTVNGDGGTDLVLVKRTNAPTYVNGGAGNDSINIGSTQAVDFGNLDLIKQIVIVNGGAGSDLLYLNDRAAVGEFEYDVYPQSVSNTATGPARAFAGVNYDGGIDNLRLDGTDDRNVFSVRPSFNTHYFIDGNLPSRNQVDAASQGDFLNLVTVPNDGHQLNLTNRDTGTGFWNFTNGLARVDFTEIEQFNHVERLAIGSDSHSFNQLIVRDAESGNLLFDIQPYEATFHGAVRVATGDINGDGIPDIITAPGPGRVATVKVFDGWDGSEIKSFNAYPSPMYDGLFVAAGNVTGSSAVDIVTAAGPGTSYSEVRVFSNTNNGNTFTNSWSFMPYGAHATAGASIAVGNVNNDAYDDIITAPLHGRVQIAVFAGKAGNQGLTELARFHAFGSDFYGGALVTAGNYLGDGRADIIVGAGHNTGPGQYSSLVQVFDGASLPYQPLNFIPADFSFKAFGNDRVSVSLTGKDYNLDGQMDQLFAGQGPHGQADVIRVFQPLSGAIVDTVFEDFDGVFLG